MGSGRWDANTYTTRSQTKLRNHGTTFAYDQQTRSRPIDSWSVHEDLDPKRENKAGAHAGKITREALDSDEHPTTLPIAVIFDETGSMHQLPQILQKKLPALHALLLTKGYVEHPQVLFGGVGDAYTDRVPLQISQFESDNRMDEHLENIFLEGNGGGQMKESYQLAAYFLARHTYLDSVEKRGKKGYCFVIGDELPYDQVDVDQVRKLIGDELAENLSTDQIFEELQERFEVFFLYAKQGSYTESQILPRWRELLGERALVLEDVGAVCETVALTIGLLEDKVNLSQGLADLEEVSTDLSSVKAAGKALASVGAGASTSPAVVTDGDGLDTEDEDEMDGIENPLEREERPMAKQGILHDYDLRANQEKSAVDQTCVVCEDQPARYQWSDYSGEAMCVRCGAPYQLKWGSNEQREKDDYPYLNLKPEWVPVVREYWQETGAWTYLGTGFRCPGLDAFLDWVAENEERLREEHLNIFKEGGS